MSEEVDSSAFVALPAGEHMRLRPSMYLGWVPDDPAALNVLVQEGLCLAIDEVWGGRYDEIRLLAGADGAIQVADNDRRLAMEQTDDGTYIPELIFTALGSCRPHKENPPVGANCCLVGIVFPNRLGEWMHFRNHRDGFCCFQEYREGVPVSPFEIESKTSHTGVEIAFKPDQDIIKNPQFDWLALARWFSTVGVPFEQMDVQNNEGQSPEHHTVVFQGLRRSA